jgi:ATP-dependent Clp protease ATP-binding subunit ClpA
LELASSAVDFLVSKGYDDAMGARPLKRAVRRYVEDPLAEGLLSEKLKPGKVRGKISRTKDALEFSQDRRYSHSVASSESEEMS